MALTLALAILISAVAAVLIFANNKKRPWKLSYADQRVVILGASSGIGRNLAHQLAQRGAQLLLVARRKDRLEAVRSECLSIHRSKLEGVVEQPVCELVVGDIADEHVLSAVAASAQTTFRNTNDGPACIDLLVLCAGVTSLSTFEDLCRLDENDPHKQQSNTSNLINTIFSTNVTSFMLATKHFLPLLQRSLRGQIVVVSSVAGVIAAPTRSLYSATKHAINGFFNALRIELRRSGNGNIVDVCVAMPGTVDTDLRSSAIDATTNPSSATTTSSATTKKRSSGISPSKCASIIINASDRGDRDVYIPSYYRYAVMLSWLWPSLIDKLAAKKYKFE